MRAFVVEVTFTCKDGSVGTLTNFVAADSPEAAGDLGKNFVGDSGRGLITEFTDIRVSEFNKSLVIHGVAGKVPDAQRSDLEELLVVA